MKITVVGAGFYGSTLVQRIAEADIVDEVVMTDIIEDKPQGLALDMMQARSIEGFETRIIGSNGYDDHSPTDYTLAAVFLLELAATFVFVLFHLLMSSTVERGVPAGNRAASRGSARLHGVAHAPATGTLTTTGGKLVSCGAVLVECRWRNAWIVATGSS